MHSRTTGSGMGASDSTATEYFGRSAMRTRTEGGDDSIIRFDEKKILTLDHRTKTYSEVTFDQLQTMLDRAGEALEEHGEEMETVKKMMGLADMSITVTEAGPGETIAGYPTAKYLLRGPMEIEIHAATDLRIPPAYYDMMKLRAPDNPVLDMKKLIDEMKRIEGFPLKTVTTMKMMNMEMKTTRVVTSIEKGAIPAAVFEIPAGYRRVQADREE
ncbi:MAG: DUF4412 domain-containing protein [Acidobacteria bacterium]|nr:DUF4412 domain-containing protein [Acidobacteriota bacterium]